jgi:hypothetical protein
MPTITDITAIITAVGALGTAAFGLVDALKALPGGGVSRAGFKFIRQTVVSLTPKVPALDGTGLSYESIETTLLSQWINGTATADQVNIAKSLIKLRLTPDTAPALAKSTGVDSNALRQVATSLSTGTALDQPHRDAYARFDLMLTTLLDQAYQRASQRYRNASKAFAVPVAVILAVVANHFLSLPTRIADGEAVLIGLIATPIAPIAKDVASAINTAAQTIQTVRKG